MKTLTMIKKTFTTIVLSLLAIALFTTSAVADDGVCVVRTTQDGVDNSLSRYIMDFNYDDSADQATWRRCTRMIRFELSGGADTVEVRQPLVINNTSTSAESDDTFTIDGGGVALKSYMPERAVIFTVRGTHNVTIKNFTIKQNSGTGSVFAKCENGSTNIKFENITIDNNPNSAIRVDGCENVQISGLKILRSADDMAGTVDDMATVNDTTDDVLHFAVIDVKNTGGFTLSTDIDEALNPEIKNTLGTLLKMQNVSNASVDLKALNIITGTVADLNDVQLSSLKVTGTNVQNGIVLNDVEGLAEGLVSITLRGLAENVEGLEQVPGTGLVLNVGARQNHFENLEISRFVGNGIEVYDASDDNLFHNANIHDNTASGIVISDEAFNNEITDSTVSSNRVCGIVLGSSRETRIYNTNLGGNGLGCPIDVAAEADNVVQLLNLIPGSVVLVPTGLNTIQVDIDPDLDIFGAASKVELHQWTSFGGSDSVAPDNSLVAPVINNFSPIQAGAETSQVALSSDLTASIENTAQTFMVVVRNDQDFVQGVWYGEAEQASTNTSGSAYDSNSCYTDPGDPSVQHRLVTTIDSDGDGLNDWAEDANQNCKRDEGETNADLPDTDGDGLSDGDEVNNVGTDPILPDTDGEGLTDGQEEFSVPPNATQDLTGESNPKDTDTDGDDLDDAFEVNIGSNPNKPDSDNDGTKDGEDNCPTLHPNQGTCYYDYCDPDRQSPAGGDADNDGLDDRFEDHSAPFCKYNPEAGETDPQNPDTDGDGLQDGQEDRSNDGVVDQAVGETDPKVADTDSDCIVDGSEDNGDGVIKPGDKETNPLSRDSDEDGIEDGAEDKNCNGNTEPGETASYLADTDGDGSLDGPGLGGLGEIDVCPWSQVPGCVVYYHGVSGFDRDSDGDGLMDKFEDGDGNGLHNPEKKEASPLKSDTDVDGASDALEWCMSSNPVVQDTDGDGRLDGEEILGRKLTPEDFEPAGDVIIGPSISVGMNSLVRYQTQGGGSTTSETGPIAEPDTYFCTTLHQLNQTNPNKYDGANCSLDAKKDATSHAHLPITLIGVAMAILMVLRLRKEA